MPKKTLANALSKRIQATPSAIDQQYDEMYGITHDTSNEKIVELPLSGLKPHPKDPFRYYTEEKLRELMESISKVGLLDPINVRMSVDGGYEILSGKNRTKAFNQLEIEKIPAIVRDVDDDTAILIITDSNLRNREFIPPSEKGWAYRLQLEAISRQGQRKDLTQDSTSVHDEQKTSRSIVAARNQVKDSEIQRYIRLTYLLPDILDFVDNKKLPLMSGVSLSYLDEQAQTVLYDYLKSESTKKKISATIAGAIRERYESRKNSLTSADLVELMEGKKVSKTFSINRKKFKQYADSLPGDEELELLFLEFLHTKYGGVGGI